MTNKASGILAIVAAFLALGLLFSDLRRTDVARHMADLDDRRHDVCNLRLRIVNADNRRVHCSFGSTAPTPTATTYDFQLEPSGSWVFSQSTTIAVICDGRVRFGNIEEGREP